MKVKSSSLLFLTLAASLVACNKDEPGTQITATNIYKVASIVAPQDGTPSAAISSYTTYYDLVKGTAKISCADLSADNRTVSFETAPLELKTWAEQGEFAVNSVKVTGHVPMVSTGVQIENLNMYLTDGIYDLKRSAPGVTNEYGTSLGLFMQYDLGGATKVKTLPADITFGGSTVTSYPSEDGMQAYQNDDIKYRIVFDMKSKKADVVLYDAKFAPPAPALKGLVLRGLDVTFTADAGFKVSGTEIIPEAFEGPEAATPNPRYVFNSFELYSSSSDLTSAKCDYQVSQVFRGSFSGSALQFKN